jgi:protocatechuate 3,4-dioxygenase beta subunit
MLTLLMLVATVLVGVQAPAGETASVRGRVVDAMTGDPIGRAVVELTPAAASRNIPIGAVAVMTDGAVTTDADGVFDLTGVEPGPYRLRVSRNGFVSVPADGDADAAVLDLVSGQVLELPVVLEPAAVISGRIYGDQGSLLPRIEVEAFRLPAGDGPSSSLPIASAMTGERGEYRLYWLTPGEYRIRARVSPTPAGQYSQNMAPLPVSTALYFPGVAAPEDARPVVVEAGSAVSGIDLTLGGLFSSPDEGGGSPAPGATISGIATREGTGEPLSGVLIEVTPDRGDSGLRGRVGVAALSALTDSDGRYRLSGVSEGDYRLAAYRDGFVRFEYEQPRPGADGAVLEVTSDDPITVPVTLTPAGTVAGRIYDANGEAMPQVAVQAFQPRWGPDGTRTLDLIQTAVTDDRGQYRLFWLTPGSYLVVADRIGPFAGGALSRTTNVAPHAMFAPTYYPGTPVESEAAFVEVLPGDIGGRMDFEVTPATPTRLTGRVVTSIPGARVGGILALSRVGAAATGGSLMMRKDEAGRFEVPDLLPGTYDMMTAVSTPDGSISRTTRVQVPPEGIEDLEIRIERGVPVPVRIFVEDEAGATVRIPEDILFADSPRIRVMLETPDGQSHLANTYEVDADFIFRDLAPGAYRLRIPEGNSEYFLKSVRFQSEEVRDDFFEIAPGRSAIDILLSRRGGHVAGVVRDEDDAVVGGVNVVLIPGEPLRNDAIFYRTRVSDADGRFDLDAVAPGTYRLFAWDDLEPYRYYDPDFVGRFEHRGFPIAIEESDQRVVDVELIRVP